MRIHAEPFAIPFATTLAAVVDQARDAGVSADLFDDPSPSGIGMVALGRLLDLVVDADGAHAEDASGVIVARITRDDRLRALSELWQQMTATDDPEARQLIAVGGFAFRPERAPAPPWLGFPAAMLRIPEVLVRRRKGRSDAIRFRAEGAVSSAFEWLTSAASGDAVYHAPASSKLVTAPSRPPYQWMADVDLLVEQLRDGAAQKVVLARELRATGDGPFDATSIVRELARRQPSCYRFLVPGEDGSALVGASPELLVRREGNRATSQPMAGTAARGRDAREDGELARALQASEKNAHEHELVVDDVRRLYRDAAAAKVLVTPRELLRFPNVQHLASTVTAHFDGAAPHVLDLCALLHPTAAVGGAPWPAASALIDEHERMERGWYAGAVGWTDSRGDGVFAVTLRCGLLWEDEVHLYAGAGVMPDSTSLDELEETDLKFLAMLDSLRAARTTPLPTALDAR